MTNQIYLDPRSKKNDPSDDSVNLVQTSPKVCTLEREEGENNHEEGHRGSKTNHNLNPLVVLCISTREKINAGKSFMVCIR